MNNSSNRRPSLSLQRSTSIASASGFFDFPIGGGGGDFTSSSTMSSTSSSSSADSLLVGLQEVSEQRKEELAGHLSGMGGLKLTKLFVPRVLLKLKSLEKRKNAKLRAGMAGSFKRSELALNTLATHPFWEMFLLPSPSSSTTATPKPTVDTSFRSWESHPSSTNSHQAAPSRQQQQYQQPRTALISKLLHQHGEDLAFSNGDVIQYYLEPAVSTGVLIIVQGTVLVSHVADTAHGGDGTAMSSSSRGSRRRSSVGSSSTGGSGGNATHRHQRWSARSAYPVTGPVALGASSVFTDEPSEEHIVASGDVDAVFIRYSAVHQLLSELLASGVIQRHVTPGADEMIEARQKVLAHHYPLTQHLLSQCWLMDVLPSKHHRDLLATRLIPRSFLPKEKLAEKGDAHDAIYFLRRGTVSVFCKTPTRTTSPQDPEGHVTANSRQQLKANITIEGASPTPPQQRRVQSSATRSPSPQSRRRSSALIPTVLAAHVKQQQPPRGNPPFIKGATSTSTSGQTSPGESTTPSPTRKFNTLATVLKSGRKDTATPSEAAAAAAAAMASKTQDSPPQTLRRRVSLCTEPQVVPHRSPSAKAISPPPLRALDLSGLSNELGSHTNDGSSPNLARGKHGTARDTDKKVTVKGSGGPLPFLEEVSSCAVFGEMGILLGEEWNMTIECSTMVDAWVLPRADLEQFMAMEAANVVGPLFQRVAHLRCSWLWQQRIVFKMDVLPAALSRVPYLRTVPRQVLLDIAQLMKPRVFLARSSIASTSEWCDTLMVLTKGSASTQHTSIKHGRENFAVGDVIGHRCVFKHRWIVPVCSNSLVECWHISRAELMAILHDADLNTEDSDAQQDERAGALLRKAMNKNTGAKSASPSAKRKSFAERLAVLSSPRAAPSKHDVHHPKPSPPTAPPQQQVGSGITSLKTLVKAMNLSGDDGKGGKSIFGTVSALTANKKMQDNKAKERSKEESTVLFKALRHCVLSLRDELHNLDIPLPAELEQPWAITVESELIRLARDEKQKETSAAAAAGVAPANNAQKAGSNEAERKIVEPTVINVVSSSSSEGGRSDDSEYAARKARRERRRRIQRRQPPPKMQGPTRGQHRKPPSVFHIAEESPVNTLPSRPQPPPMSKALIIADQQRLAAEQQLLAAQANTSSASPTAGGPEGTTNSNIHQPKPKSEFQQQLEKELYGVTPETERRKRFKASSAAIGGAHKPSRVMKNQMPQEFEESDDEAEIARKKKLQDIVDSSKGLSPNKQKRLSRFHGGFGGGGAHSSSQHPLKQKQHVGDNDDEKQRQEDTEQRRRKAITNITNSTENTFGSYGKSCDTVFKISPCDPNFSKGQRDSIPLTSLLCEVPTHRHDVYVAANVVADLSAHERYELHKEVLQQPQVVKPATFESKVLRDERAAARQQQRKLQQERQLQQQEDLDKTPMKKTDSSIPPRLETDLMSIAFRAESPVPDSPSPRSTSMGRQDSSLSSMSPTTGRRRPMHYVHKLSATYFVVETAEAIGEFSSWMLQLLERKTVCDWVLEGSEPMPNTMVKIPVPRPGALGDVLGGKKSKEDNSKKSDENKKQWQKATSMVNLSNRWNAQKQQQEQALFGGGGGGKKGKRSRNQSEAANLEEQINKALGIRTAHETKPRDPHTYDPLLPQRVQRQEQIRYEERMEKLKEQQAEDDADSSAYVLPHLPPEKVDPLAGWTTMMKAKRSDDGTGNAGDSGSESARSTSAARGLVPTRHTGALRGGTTIVDVKKKKKNVSQHDQKDVDLVAKIIAKNQDTVQRIVESEALKQRQQLRERKLDRRRALYKEQRRQHREDARNFFEEEWSVMMATEEDGASRGGDQRRSGGTRGKAGRMLSSRPTNQFNDLFEDSWDEMSSSVVNPPLGNANQGGRVLGLGRRGGAKSSTNPSNVSPAKKNLQKDGGSGHHDVSGAEGNDEADEEARVHKAQRFLHASTSRFELQEQLRRQQRAPQYSSTRKLKQQQHQKHNAGTATARGGVPKPPPHHPRAAPPPATARHDMSHSTVIINVLESSQTPSIHHQGVAGGGATPSTGKPSPQPAPPQQVNANMPSTRRQRRASVAIVMANALNEKEDTLMPEAVSRTPSPTIPTTMSSAGGVVRRPSLQSGSRYTHFMAEFDEAMRRLQEKEEGLLGHSKRSSRRGSFQRGYNRRGSFTGSVSSATPSATTSVATTSLMFPPQNRDRFPSTSTGSGPPTSGGSGGGALVDLIDSINQEEAPHDALHNHSISDDDEDKSTSVRRNTTAYFPGNSSSQHQSQGPFTTTSRGEGGDSGDEDNVLSMDALLGGFGETSPASGTTAAEDIAPSQTRAFPSDDDGGIVEDRPSRRYVAAVGERTIATGGQRCVLLKP